jgi:hypothetical protein
MRKAGVRSQNSEARINKAETTSTDSLLSWILDSVFGGYLLWWSKK